MRIVVFLFTSALLLSGCQSDIMRYNYKNYSEHIHIASDDIKLIEVDSVIVGSNSISSQFRNDPYKKMQSIANTYVAEGAEILGEVEIYSDCKIDIENFKEFCRVKGSTICVYYISPIYSSMPNASTSYLLRSLILFQPKDS